MSEETTTAWVLHAGPVGAPQVAELVEETVSFPSISEDEILVEPLYGSWEGNMTHALKRDPIDICRLRGEERVVLGNAGVVRVLRCGRAVTDLQEGVVCMLIPIGEVFEGGLTKKVFGYDARRSIGLLAKRTKVRRGQLIPVPETRHSLLQWAAFSIRYPTAWANWKVALASFRLKVTEEESPHVHVWAWGGGVSIAELGLAKLDGCEVSMIASSYARLELARSLGFHAIDRRTFSALSFDAVRAENDPPYKRDYLEAEWAFLQQVRAGTNSGVSIFIDNIGAPVHRATLRALAPGGVIATCGWLSSAHLTVNRAAECMTHHTHVYTHGCKYSQGLAAFHFADRVGWLPPIANDIWPWADVPKLARDSLRGAVDSYFPLFEVNKL